MTTSMAIQFRVYASLSTSCDSLIALDFPVSKTTAGSSGPPWRVIVLSFFELIFALADRAGMLASAQRDCAALKDSRFFLDI